MNMDMDNAKFFEIVLSQVQDMMKAKGIQISDQSSLVQVLRISMECVELIRDEKLKGSDKKNIVLKVLRFLVEKSNLSDEKKTLMRSIIEGGSLETTIDLLIDASKGQFEFNRKTKRRLLACMGDCLVTASGRKRNNRTITTDNTTIKITKEVFL